LLPSGEIDSPEIAGGVAARAGTARRNRRRNGILFG
jgi:hypothetical protein